MKMHCYFVISKITWRFTLDVITLLATITISCFKMCLHISLIQHVQIAYWSRLTMEHDIWMLAQISIYGRNVLTNQWHIGYRKDLWWIYDSQWRNRTGERVVTGATLEEDAKSQLSTGSQSATVMSKHMVHLSSNSFSKTLTTTIIQDVSWQP